LDVVSKAVERMAQEILVKQERNAWAVVLKALSEGMGATASTKGSHIINDVGTTRIFNLDILNSMITKAKRMNSSFAAGSPAVPYSEGVTDLYVSPEVKQDIRTLSYSPLGNNATVSLPEDVKSGAYKAAGIASIFGINIVDMLELGVGQKYNTLYETFSDAAGIAGGTSPTGAAVTTAFDDSAKHEVCIGVDASRDALIRPVARNSESGSTFTALPDDQYSQRADKTGFYGSVEEGRVCIDARVLIGAHLKRTA
jgi:hypothetical protein